MTLNDEPLFIEDPCTVDDEAQKCNYIDGRMTLFTDGSDTDESSAVKNLVCEALNSKDMTLAHPAIKGIDCTFLNGSTPGENGGDGTPPVIAPASQSYATPVVVMSALAGIMVVFGVYAYRRRQRKDEPELPAHKAYLDDSDVNNSNSVSFDDAPMAWSAKHNTNSPAFDMHSIIPKGYSPVRIYARIKKILPHTTNETLLTFFCIYFFRRQLKKVQMKMTILTRYLSTS